MYQVLRRIWTVNSIPEELCKGIIQKKTRDTGNNVEIIGVTLLYQTFKIYDRIVANEMIQEIK
jgi:hypothetical protein